LYRTLVADKVKLDLLILYKCHIKESYYKDVKSGFMTDFDHIF